MFLPDNGPPWAELVFPQGSEHPPRHGHEDLTTLMVDDHPMVALEALLRPFPGSDPSGRSLQYDPIYDEIKDARRADDVNAPRDIWAKDLKAADWRTVQELCQEALVNESKDLQICAWLMEAWLHLEGLKGLRRGVELLLQMSESFWETVHPALAEGVDFRVSPFVWINEKMPVSLGQLNIVAPEGDAALTATWDDWKRALWLEKVRAQRPQDTELEKEAERSPSVSEFRSRCSKTPELFFRDNLAVLDDAIGATRTLEAFLDDRLEKQSPSLVRFREALSELHTWTRVVLREGSFRPNKQEKGEPQGDADMAEESSPEVDEAAEAASTPTGNPANPPAPRCRTHRRTGRRLPDAPGRRRVPQAGRAPQPDPVPRPEGGVVGRHESRRPASGVCA